MRLKPALFVLTVALGTQATPHKALAETAHDSLPVMSWEEMKGCEIVVAAHYESHTTGDGVRDDPEVKSGLIRVRPQILTLHIDRVLKGAGIKIGDALRVELRHWYSIETYPTESTWRERAKDDGIARLCYQYQFSNPGALQPEQIVPDVRKEMLYFLPKASDAALVRMGQIQSTDLEKDWRRAVLGANPSLAFRVTQVNSDRARQKALDELNGSRDAVTLDALFDWLSMPYNRNGLAHASLQTLIAVGDRKGDVYNRARKRLFAGIQNWNSYNNLSPDQQLQYRKDQSNNEGEAGKQQRCAKYAYIMAKVDGDRAAHDFERLIRAKTPVVSTLALQHLGMTDSVYALNLAFQLLKNSETVQAGAETIRNLLIPGYRQELVYPSQSVRTAELKALAIPRLKEALQLPTFDASRTEAARDAKAPFELRYLRSLRETLEGFLPRQTPPPVDLAHAEQVLLHPDIDRTKLIESSFESDWTPVEKEGIATLVAIDNERDLRFIPLLVKLMKDVSPWLKSQEGYRALSRYSQMFPHAFKMELDKQGLTGEILETSLRQGFPGSPGRMLNRPHALWSLSRYDDSGFALRSLDDGDELRIQRYKSSPQLLRALSDFVIYTLAQDYIIVDLDSLRFLVAADSKAARPLVEQTLNKVEKDAAINHYTTQVKVPYLALGIAVGHKEMEDELLDAFPIPAQEPIDTNIEHSYQRHPQMLLWANTPHTFARYLQIVDAALKADGESNLLTRSRKKIEYPSTEKMIQALFAQHPHEFFERTLRLIRSSSLRERTLGRSLLQNAIYWDADFDPNLLTRERTMKLKTIVPLVERLASLQEEQMRVALLRHFNVNLPKDREKRQIALRQLLSNSNPTVARNALRLLELQTGDYYAEFLWHSPAEQKERLWNAMVTDHALAYKDAPAPLRVGL